MIFIRKRQTGNMEIKRLMIYLMERWNKNHKNKGKTKIIALFRQNMSNYEEHKQERQKVKWPVKSKKEEAQTTFRENWPNHEEYLKSDSVEISSFNFDHVFESSNSLAGFSVKIVCQII